MEIEMKYSIRNKEQAEEIWKDEYLAKIEEPNTREKILMKAVYFDTEDYVLSKHDIAFRIRKEENITVASLKWRGKSVGGLHIREELNVPVNDDSFFIVPDPSVFKESEIGREVIEMIGKSQLQSILETNFVRSNFRIDVDNSIMEVSLDRGNIITEKGNVPINEIEIELFSGEEESLVEVGKKIAEKYDLEPEIKSKYLRGLIKLGFER